MDNQIEKFDPSTLMQGVKDRIKATFVSLIPDDQWEVMVKKEIDSFFDPTVKYSKEVTVNNYNNGYNSGYNTKVLVTGETSVFRAIIFQLCIEKTCDVLKKELSETYFKECYSFEKMDEQLKKIIEQAAPLAARTFMESMAMGYAQRLRDDIMNHRI